MLTPIAIRFPLVVGLAIAALALGASAAGAQDAVVLAQVETDSTGEGEPREAPRATSTTTTPGIEERVILAGESEGMGDFDTGDSVTGFNASDLEALGAQSVADLGKFTPNLEIVTSGATTPTFFIRGVGLNDFNPNSAGAVALYHDDVPINAPALQLGTLFDMEAVNILRGPQGFGPNRNASAGAIKLYSRKPTGKFGGYLYSTYGNYNYLNFEGAIEAPIYEDILSSRFAFRVSERDGYATNDCADVPPKSERGLFGLSTTRYPPQRDNVHTHDRRYSVCGEEVYRGEAGATNSIYLPWPRVPQVQSDGYSTIPTGLPSKVNDLGNWAARGMLRFQPTLDMDWLLGAHGSRRDELSRLGQSYGTATSRRDQVYIDPDNPLDSAKDTHISGMLGEEDRAGYIQQEVYDRLLELNYCKEPNPNNPRGQDILPRPPGCQSNRERNIARYNAELTVMNELADNLDSDPYRGAYDSVGPTKNDTWGLFLKGDIALPNEIALTTVTGYDTYDRLTDTDLDFTPNILFEIRTDDDAWQFSQDLALSGEYSDLGPLRWNVGTYYLMEDLHVRNDYRIGDIDLLWREYTQKIWSAAGYASVEWDFWDDFTLDGGFRYNWERKTMLFQIQRTTRSDPSFNIRTWSAPSGGVRLTYRFREDTSAFWKYTRGWKPGHFNATSDSAQEVTVAEPETLNAYEAGLHGGWFEGRLNFDLSLFYYDYQDYQIFIFVNQADGNPQFVVLNANNAEIYGAEIELMSRPWPGFFANVRFSWIESRFIDFVQERSRYKTFGTTRQLLKTELNYSGNRVLNTPRFKVSLTAEQTLPLGRWGSLTARYDGAWTDTTYFDATQGHGLPNEKEQLFLPEDTIGQKPYWLHNLRLGYRVPGGNIEIAGWVRNLTDEVYKTFAADLTSFNEIVINFLGEPRTYGMTVSVDF